MKRMFCVLTMLCVLASCVTVHAEENAATLDGTNGDVLYQVALIQSLVQGYYDGIITVGELKQHGDTGIGKIIDVLSADMTVSAEELQIAARKLLEKDYVLCIYSHKKDNGYTSYIRLSNGAIAEIQI